MAVPDGSQDDSIFVGDRSSYRKGGDKYAKLHNPGAPFCGGIVVMIQLRRGDSFGPMDDRQRLGPAFSGVNDQEYVQVIALHVFLEF